MRVSNLKIGQILINSGDITEEQLEEVLQKQKASNGSKSANSGSVYVLRMSTNGQLSLEKSYKNICGKIVDFETNTSEEE